MDDDVTIGVVTIIDVDDVVVGDMVLLQSGDKIPADGILIDGDLRVDNSALNGEAEECKKTAADESFELKEILAKANMWELSHGGMSGRSATQFITYLQGQK